MILVSNTNFEKIFKQFKREVEREGIIKEMKEREFYEKPSEIRKRKKLRKYRPHITSQK
ncbi:MAG: 30S ribosomal protein S21 [Candidatus Omnitrophica bacterium]|nr:30S ribosomal protein S21 [Candidatus Omnitrophota bacterium]